MIIRRHIQGLGRRGLSELSASTLLGKDSSKKAPIPKTNPKNLELYHAGHPTRGAMVVTGYPFGDLIVWDRNGDGKYRWWSGDRITTRDGRKVRARDVAAKRVLETLGIKSFGKGSSLWSLAKKYQGHQNPSPEILSGEELVQAQMDKVQEAVDEGDFKALESTLAELKVLIRETEIDFDEEDIEAIKNEARFNHYLQEAAISLAQGRPELAFYDLKLAKKYADLIGYEWEAETVAQALLLLGAYKFEESVVKRLLKQIKDPIKNK